MNKYIYTYILYDIIYTVVVELGMECGMQFARFCMCLLDVLDWRPGCFAVLFVNETELFIWSLSFV